ncbi:putative bifunctional diguanylate cyclase/phosphodiesterase [Hwanghaeella sp.]|uniref:putative bifunctional diguanylate cyclase/phosphodiesterase n=1 Tax=Hwanghaeella sp. TaxID=2605943 RepID=UPI003CCC28C0
MSSNTTTQHPGGSVIRTDVFSDARVRRHNGGDRPQAVRDVNLLRAALASSGDIGYVWDLVDDSIQWIGDTFPVFGPTRSDSIRDGEAFNECINVEDLSKRLQSLSRHLQAGEAFDCEYRLRREDGEFVWVHDKGRADLDEHGIPVRLAGILRPINRRKQQETLLERRASYDDLTGHLNKTRLHEALQNAFSYNKRYNVPGGYLAIGIDKLSMVNEAYGHKIADALIVGVGHRIERALRVTDQIGRLGGDRFGVVLGQCDEAGMVTTSEKILEALRASPIETPNGNIHVTVSIGGTVFPGLIQTAQEAMTAAESAMQAAKTKGRNCFVSYELSEEQRRVRRENLDMGERIMQALEDDRIIFAYQPVVDSLSKEVSYYETLLRMKDPSGDIVSAGAFVPVAEKLGIMRFLDHRALEMALDDLGRYPDVILALNISSLTVTDQSWLRTLVSRITSKPSMAERLIVEITETAALEDFEVSARFVSAVRALGCKVALDDFGSGYTSFRHMKALTVDVVKIDGAFVKDVHTNMDNQLFVRTLLGLADGFGLKTVAECVETEDEVRVLCDEGANFLQGWFFGRPDVDPPWRT